MALMILCFKRFFANFLRPPHPKIRLGQGYLTSTLLDGQDLLSCLGRLDGLLYLGLARAIMGRGKDGEGGGWEKDEEGEKNGEALDVCGAFAAGMAKGR